MALQNQAVDFVNHSGDDFVNHSGDKFVNHSGLCESSSKAADIPQTAELCPSRVHSSLSLTGEH